MNKPEIPAVLPPPQPARWRFGDTELDEFRLQIVHRGEPVAVEPKTLELLRTLVRHPGEVLTKEELLEAIWPGRILSESVLARSVSMLRRALGDEQQTLIRTVHGYGYRFDTTVERLTPLKTESTPLLGLKPGDHPPLRPNWNLSERLGEGRNDTWLAEHDKTRERRVFKFAADGASLAALKREITLHRLLTESLPGRRDLVPVLDWNLREAPYFIETEWCAGGSLERWMATHPQTPLPLRLELVAQAAEALAAAHSVGVLHKDVKPANLLVDQSGARPQIRLADFGSGLLLDEARLQALSITRLGLTRTAGDDDGSSGSGTPLYLAPELLAGQPATPKTDIYALGVILYQLVVGDLRRPLAPGWEREVTDELLREDIAAAADVDPARRLGDAAQLAQRLRTLGSRRLRRDDERELALRAAAERRQLERWRAQRLWIAAAFLALIAGLTVSTALYFGTRSARDQARMAQAEAAAVNDFLQNDLLAAANPEQTGRRDITVREVLESATQRAGERFAEQPRLEAAVRKALGGTLLGMGSFEQAIVQMRSALALLEQQGENNAGERAALRLDIARALFDLDQRDAGRLELVAVLAMPPTPALVAYQLDARVEIASLDSSRNTEQALAAFKRLQAEAERVLPPNAALTLRIGQYHAAALCKLGRINECLDGFRANIALRERAGSQRTFDTLTARADLARTLMSAGRDAEALASFEQLHEQALKMLGPAHRFTLSMARELATAAEMDGEFDRAEQLLKETMEVQTRVLGAEHNDTLTTRSTLAYLYSRLGKSEQALAIYRDVHAAHSAKLGESSSESLGIAHNIGRALQDLGRWQQAADVQRHILPLSRQSLPESYWLTPVILYALARSEGMLSHYDEAEKLFAESIERLENSDIDPRYLEAARKHRDDMRKRRAQGQPAAVSPR